MNSTIKNAVIATSTGLGVNYLLDAGKTLMVNSKPLESNLLVWTKLGLSPKESILANLIILGFVVAGPIGTIIGTVIKKRSEEEC